MRTGLGITGASSGGLGAVGTHRENSPEKMADDGGAWCRGCRRCGAGAAKRIALGDVLGDGEQARVQWEARGGCSSPESTEELVGAVVAWACNSCSLVAEGERGLGGKREEGEAFKGAWSLSS